MLYIANSSQNFKWDEISTVVSVISAVKIVDGLVKSMNLEKTVPSVPGLFQ